MHLSVAYSFEPSLLERLAAIPHVTEIYGKLNGDCIGGGRSSYTLRSVSKRKLQQIVDKAHAYSIGFNYLLNGANLGGLEHTRQGQRKIRKQLDFCAECKVDSITVAVPYLLRLIKTHYPQFKVRIGAFARIADKISARMWEDMGADTLCISAIACNRDFRRLSSIRQAVDCNLELIVNASCLPHCAYELTHMQMLTRSSRSGDTLDGFCLDYCFLHCSSKKLMDPVHYIRSIWIRPEDLKTYENLGYTHFKIVERSSPPELLLKRVEAYANRSFDGNLMELIAPVAYVKKSQGLSLQRQAQLAMKFFRPNYVKTKTLLKMKQYAESIIPHTFDRRTSPVYIDNKSLDGFLCTLQKKRCTDTDCSTCGFCAHTARKFVKIDLHYRDRALGLASHLDKGFLDGTHWFDTDRHT